MKGAASAGWAAPGSGPRGPLRRLVLATLLLLAVSPPAARPGPGPEAAVDPLRDAAANPVQDAARDPEELDALTARVAAELRCPVCRNQSVLESSAELSREMQGVIRDRLADGESPEQVKAWFVSRYGEWILLKPEPRGLNLLVYVLPAAALVLGALLLARVLRRWLTRGAAAPGAGGGVCPPGRGGGTPETTMPTGGSTIPLGEGPRDGRRRGSEQAPDGGQDGLSLEDRRWLEEAIRSDAPAHRAGTRSGSSGIR